MNKYARLITLLSLLANPYHLFAADTFFSLERRATSLRNTPSNVSTITAEDIQNTGAKTTAEMLDQLTSVDLTRNGTLGSFSTARIRGVSSSNQIRIFVDDQPMNGIAADSNFDVSQIPVETIERIEVVRGGSSVLYGANTTGGVINIITKKAVGKPNSFEMGGDVGSHQTFTGRVLANASSGLADAGVALTGYETDGFQNNSDAKDNNGTLNLGFSGSGGSRLSLRLFHNKQEGGVAQGTPVPFNEWDGEKEKEAINPTKRFAKERVEGRLGVDLPVGENQLAMSVYGSDAHAETTESADTFEPDFKNVNQILGGDTRFLTKQGFTAGVEYERDYFRDTLLDPHHVTNVGGYVQQEIVADSVRIVPALRYDHHGTFGSQYNPRVSAVVAPTEVFSISGNVARSFRAPGFFELYGDFPSSGYTANRNLNPEKAWTYDLGFSVHPNPDTEVKLTGYYTDIKDRIEGINTDLDSFDETNANVSQSELSGVELEGIFKTGILSHNMNYSFKRSRSSSAEESKFVPLAFTPTHTFNYQMKLMLPQSIALINTAQYVSDQYSDVNYGGIHVPPYALWHARAEKRFSKGSLYAGANNILDRRYSDARDFNFAFPFNAVLVPMDGRTYYAGVSVKIGGTVQ